MFSKSYENTSGELGLDETTWGETTAITCGEVVKLNFRKFGKFTEAHAISRMVERILNWELEEGVGEALTSEHKTPKLAGGQEIFVKFLFYVFFG